MSSTNKRFYGWYLVVVCGLLYGLLGSFGLSASQIAIPVMATDPDVAMNRSMIGLGFTIFVLAQGLPGPLIGQLIAKKGAKLSYIISGIAVAVTGVLLANFIGVSTIAYLALFGVVLSVGSTMGGQLATQTTISNWFLVKRGTAMSITMAFAGLLGFTFPLITNAVILKSGSWHMGFYVISIVAVIGLILAIIFIRNKPADLGQVPDGAVAADPGKQAKVRVTTVYKTSKHKTYKEALKTPAFWFILITSFSIFCALNMAVSSGVLHFTGLGLSSTIVAGAVSAQGVAGVIVRVCLAPLADRIEPIRIAGICAIFVGAGAFLAATAQTDSVAVLYTYYILLGIGFGGNLIVMPTAFANYFGHTNFPKVMGTVLPLLSIFSSLIPVLAGVVFDMSGAYNTMYFIIGGIAIIGLITSLLVRFPKEDRV
ncbi:MAG: MFS transporter [Clostridiales bacterium]|nr:MFS transporter [Clostridiales bacterium]